MFKYALEGIKYIHHICYHGKNIQVTSFSNYETSEIRQTRIEYGPLDNNKNYQYSDIIMSSMASQITGFSIVHSTGCSCVDKKKSNLRVTGLCVGNSPVTGEFPTQRASNAENVSIWWFHHVLIKMPLMFSFKESSSDMSSKFWLHGWSLGNGK